MSSSPTVTVSQMPRHFTLYPIGFDIAKLRQLKEHIMDGRTPYYHYNQDPNALEAVYLAHPKPKNSLPKHLDESVPQLKDILPALPAPKDLVMVTEAVDQTTKDSHPRDSGSTSVIPSDAESTFEKGRSSRFAPLAPAVAPPVPPFIPPPVNGHDLIASNLPPRLQKLARTNVASHDTPRTSSPPPINNRPFPLTSPIPTDVGRTSPGRVPSETSHGRRASTASLIHPELTPTPLPDSRNSHQSAERTTRGGLPAPVLATSGQDRVGRPLAQPTGQDPLLQDMHFSRFASISSHLQEVGDARTCPEKSVHDQRPRDQSERNSGDYDRRYGPPRSSPDDFYRRSDRPQDSPLSAHLSYAGRPYDDDFRYDRRTGAEPQRDSRPQRGPPERSVSTRPLHPYPPPSPPRRTYGESDAEPRASRPSYEYFSRSGYPARSLDPEPRPASRDLVSDFSNRPTISSTYRSTSPTTGAAAYRPRSPSSTGGYPLPVRGSDGRFESPQGRSRPDITPPGPVSASKDEFGRDIRGPRDELHQANPASATTGSVGGSTIVQTHPPPPSNARPQHHASRSDSLPSQHGNLIPTTTLVQNAMPGVGHSVGSQGPQTRTVSEKAPAVGVVGNQLAQFTPIPAPLVSNMSHIQPAQDIMVKMEGDSDEVEMEYSPASDEHPISQLKPVQTTFDTTGTRLSDDAPQANRATSSSSGPEEAAVESKLLVIDTSSASETDNRQHSSAVPSPTPSSAGKSSGDLPGQPSSTQTNRQTSFGPRTGSATTSRFGPPLPAVPPAVTNPRENDRYTLGNPSTKIPYQPDLRLPQNVHGRRDYPLPKPIDIRPPPSNRPPPRAEWERPRPPPDRYLPHHNDRLPSPMVQPYSYGRGDRSPSPRRYPEYPPRPAYHDMDDNRGMKRPREDLMDRDRRPPPPPAWRDREAYDPRDRVGMPPLNSRPDSRAPPYAYGPDVHRYEDREREAYHSDFARRGPPGGPPHLRGVDSLPPRGGWIDPRDQPYRR